MVGWVDDFEEFAAISFLRRFGSGAAALLLLGAVDGGGITRRTELCGADTSGVGM
jgi:hypothetical protein